MNSRLKIVIFSVLLVVFFTFLWVMRTEFIEADQAPKEDKSVDITQSDSETASQSEMVLTSSTDKAGAASGGATNGIEDPDGAKSLKPLDGYLKYIELAETGDADSQYEVARAIRDCRRIPKNRSDLLAIKTSGALFDDQYHQLEQTFNNCEELKGFVPDVEEEYKKWFVEAYEGGSPLAIARERIYDYRNHDLDDLKNSLIDALRTGDSEAYRYTNIFFVNMPTANAEVYKEAWGYLACQKWIGCQTDSYSQDLENRLSKADYDEVIRLSGQIPNHIKNEEWGLLGFDRAIVLPKETD